MSVALAPLFTSQEFEALTRARSSGAATLETSLDLQRSVSTLGIGASEWTWNDEQFPYPSRWKERTVYHWSDGAFEPVARYGTSLVKLVPTDWGAPTFEIDGIKMLPSAQISPYADARRKVALIQPRDKIILDTCGGLGYFAGWCLEGGAREVRSFEKLPDVLWLRTLNPWSPRELDGLKLEQGDVTGAVVRLPGASFDAVLHDPPRFSIAGDLYSQVFYGELARVLKRGGTLFHYTGAPDSKRRGRDLAEEVRSRLRRAGFTAERRLDGLFAVKR